MTDAQLLPENLKAFRIKAATQLANMKYWPRIPKAETYVGFLFRAMRNDGSEMREPDDDTDIALLKDAMEIGIDEDRMRVVVINAVKFGSSFRSPFLHDSTSFDGARNFMMRAEFKRGQNIDESLHVP